MGIWANWLEISAFLASTSPTNQKANDRQLLDLMAGENRALLTCDRRLLMHAIVQYGYCPRSQNAEAKADVIEELEPLTKIYYEQFRRCPGCGQIYWSGSHFEKLEKRIEKIMARLVSRGCE